VVAGLGPFPLVGPVAVTLVSGRRGSLRSRRIPCHLTKEPPCPAGSSPLLPTTARLLGEAAAAFLAQPDLAASTRRSYQQTLGRLEREFGADQPLTTGPRAGRR
jgi:hypothetical protein